MARFPVSIAILTHNEESRIHRCLRSLMDSGAAEIRVIDNASTDQTCREVERFRSECPSLPLLLEPLPFNHLGLARRKAVELASQPWIAFIDADCEAPPNWIARFHEHASNGRFSQAKESSRLLGIGSGNVCPSRGQPFHEWMTIALQSFFGHLGSLQGYRPSEARRVSHLSTCNVLFDRLKLLEAGNFSEAFDRVCEDLELCVRAGSQGWILAYLPGNEVIHHHRPSLTAWAGRMLRYGFGQTLVMREHWRFALGRKSLPILFIFLLIASFSKGIVPGMVFLGSYALAMALLSTWLCFRNAKISAVPGVAAWFVMTHFSYALGEAAGVVPLIFFWARKWGPNSYVSVPPVTSKPNRR